MITLKTNFGALLSQQVAHVLLRTRNRDYIDVQQAVTKAKSVFLCGAGRSGEILKFFAMRLMHAGIEAHIVGETTTPSIGDKDLFIGISNSGETKTTKSHFEKAKSLGCQCILITNYHSMSSSMAGYADLLIPLTIKEEDKQALCVTNDITLAPMGTLFELSSLFFVEGVISAIIFSKNITESEMKKVHSNLE